MKQLFRSLTLSTALLSQLLLPIAAAAQQSLPEREEALSADTMAAEAPADADAPSSEQAPQQDAFYCGERKLGTWFYCDRPKDKPKRAEASAPSASATEQLAVISRQLDELRAKAILSPTAQNVAAYIRYQRVQLDRASTFADSWQRTVWQDPSLDYTLQRPVNTLGKSAWLDSRKNDQQTTMASLSKRYGLFFFYSSDCAACSAFSPVVKAIQSEYNIQVLPVSMDGGPNPYFRNYVVNAGQYERMGLTGGTVPALVLFDTILKKPVPVGYGAMAEDEVMDRIFRLTSVKVGSDF